MNFRKNSTVFVALLFFVGLQSLTSCHDDSPVTKRDPQVSTTPTIAMSVVTVPNDMTLYIDIPALEKPIIESGVVWSEKPSPTIADFKKSQFSERSGDRFLYSISDLLVETQYYMRAYVIFENNQVVYSQEKSATTGKHQLLSFEPVSATPGMKVSVTGDSFSLSNTELYLNGARYQCDFHASSLTFTVPSGLNTDSLSIGVKVGGRTLVFPTKLHYDK